MIPIITFTGYSNSGKTTVVSAVIKELSSRGYKVASIKHDGHGHSFDLSEKDSHKHKNAGAVCSIMTNRHGFEMLCDADRDSSPEEMLSLLPAATDIAVCEGFKGSSLPKIEVVRKGNERANEDDPELVAVVSDAPVEGVVSFDFDEISEIAGFLEDRFIKTRPEMALHLIVDGKPVQTKDFLLKMLTYSIHGLIKPLKGCDNPEEIIIKAVYPKK